MLVFHEKLRRILRTLAAISHGSSLLALLVLAVMLLAPMTARSEEYGFLTIPAKTASRNSPVELRLGIKNDTALNRWYKVEFFMDDYDTRVTPSPISIIVDSGHWGLFSYMWDSSLFPGKRRLLYEVKDWTQGDPGRAYVKRGSSSISIINSAPGVRSPSISTVAWLEPAELTFRSPHVTQSELETMVDEMHELHMDTIVVGYVELTFCIAGKRVDCGPYYPTRIAELGEQKLGYDLVGTILKQAQKNGQRVMLGLGRGPFELKLAEAFTAEDSARVREFQKRVAAELWSLYGRNGTIGDYTDTIYGWFLSPECLNYALAKDYYDKSCIDLDEYGPHMPVLVSPAGCCHGIEGNLVTSQADIFAYQDGASMGVDYSAQMLTYDPFITIKQIPSRYAMYARWHEGVGKHIWANIEAWRNNGGESKFPHNPFVASWQTQIGLQVDYEKLFVSQIMWNEWFGTFEKNSESRKAYDHADKLWKDYVRYLRANYDK